MAQRVNCSAAGIAESDPSIGAGKEEVFKQWFARFWPFGDNGFEAIENEVDGFVAEQFADWCSLW